METDKGQLTGGILAGCNKKFVCKIGDDLNIIKELNPSLTEEEALRVFNITREQENQYYE